MPTVKSCVAKSTYPNTPDFSYSPPDRGNGPCAVKLDGKIWDQKCRSSLAEFDPKRYHMTEAAKISKFLVVTHIGPSITIRVRHGKFKRLKFKRLSL